MASRTITVDVLARVEGEGALTLVLDVATLGGREIHPVNVRVGGFYRAPRRDELARLLPDLRAALDEAELSLDWLASFEYPELSRDYELVALRHPDEYPMNEGRLVSTR